MIAINPSKQLATYLTAIPVDPQGPVSFIPFVKTAYAANGTGYKIAKNTSNNIYLESASAETSFIKIGSDAGVTGTGSN